MAIKKINTDLQIEAGLLDGDGNSGVLNQVLVSTGTGVDWVDVSGIIGGPYLPLAGGTVDGTLIIDTDTGSKPFYVTRNGGLDQALKIYVDDAAAVFESIQDETANDYGSFIFNMDAGVTEPFYDIRKNNSTLMRVRGNGNVGIGTTAPGDLLEIKIPNTAQGGLKITNSAGADGYLQLGNITTTSNNFSPFITGLANSNSFPGLYFRGLTSPANDTGTTPVVRFLAMRNDTTPIATRPLYSWQGYNSGFVDYMTILPSGNVGIGTTSPTQKLHVNGSVRITDVIYDSSNSPGTAGQVLSKPTNNTIAWVNKDSITSIPTSITATPGGTLNLASNIDFVYFTWSGGSGTYTLNLPIASTHAYKIIRFVNDSTISANDKIHIQGSLGDTVDGGLFYALNKPYNGVQVWSNGSEWIVIQAKAT